MPELPVHAVYTLLRSRGDTHLFSSLYKQLLRHRLSRLSTTEDSDRSPGLFESAPVSVCGLGKPAQIYLMLSWLWTMAYILLMFPLLCGFWLCSGCLMVSEDIRTCDMAGLDFWIVWMREACTERGIETCARLFLSEPHGVRHLVQLLSPKRYMYVVCLYQPHRILPSLSNYTHSLDQ